MRTAIPLLIAAVIGLSACGDSGGSPSAARKSRGAIELDEVVAPEGCLSLPAYFDALRSVYDGTRAQVTTTKLDMTSKKAIRPGFRKALTYGTFLFTEQPLAELTDFPPVAQTGCESITFVDADAGGGEYKIVKATRESLLAQDAEGHRVGYRWLSPTSVELETRYSAYDVPCSEASEIFVDHVRVADWSRRVPETLSAGGDSPSSIDRGLLGVFAESVGRDPAELYETRDGADIVRAATLREWRSLPPSDELRTCGNLPDPSPEPAPGLPADPPSEGTVTPEPTPAPEPAPAEPAPPGEGSRDDGGGGFWDWLRS